MPLLSAGAIFLLVLLVGWPRQRASDKGFIRAMSRWLPKPEQRQSGLPGQLELALKATGIRVGVPILLPALGLIDLLLVLLMHQVLGSWPLALVIGGFALGYPLMRLQQQQQKQRELLTFQFKDALLSITYSLRSGASLNSALERTLADLRRIYSRGVDEPIIRELQDLVQQLRLGVPVEQALLDWAARLRLDDVSDFVTATLAVKQRGGNLAEVMGGISDTISWKILAQAKIRAITAEKRSEANMLVAAPPLVLLWLWLFSPHYLEPLFNTTAGQVILLIGAGCNVLAFFAVRKIVQSPL